MQTDRELLILAAKAVGGKFSPGTTKRRTGETWDTWEWIGPQGITTQTGGTIYPLTDDGAALRLAVKMQIQITPGTYNKNEFTAFYAGKCEAVEYWSTLQDEFAATRRAIVRALAEIGKAMP